MRRITGPLLLCALFVSACTASDHQKTAVEPGEVPLTGGLKSEPTPVGSLVSTLLTGVTYGDP